MLGFWHTVDDFTTTAHEFKHRHRPFEPADAEAFASLNLAWLVPFELLEPADEKQLYGFDRLSSHAAGRPSSPEPGPRLSTAPQSRTMPADRSGEAGSGSIRQGPRGRRRLVRAALAFGVERGFRRAVLTSSHKLCCSLKLCEWVGFRCLEMPSVRPTKPPTSTWSWTSLARVTSLGPDRDQRIDVSGPPGRHIGREQPEGDSSAAATP